MKKLLICFLVGLALLIGFAIGDRSWQRLQIFEALVIIQEQPSEIACFRTDGIPAYSSKHYFFKHGFTDIDEYWSFQLPPDRARNFITKYVQANQLKVIKDTSRLPKWILGQIRHGKWDNRYWFSSFNQLDEIYYKKYLFCGYSIEKNRIYLMNWND
jgi:hypothetical protein